MRVVPEEYDEHCREVLKLDVLGHTVRILMVPNGFMAGTYGQGQTETGLILLDEGLRPELQASTLLHELIHLLGDYVLTDRFPEATVTSLSSGLFAVLVQNNLDFSKLSKKGF